MERKRSTEPQPLLRSSDDIPNKVAKPVAMRVAALLLAFIVLALSYHMEFWSIPALTNYFHEDYRSIETRVNDILRKTPLIDGHNDLAYYIRWTHNNHIYLSNFTIPFETGTLGGEVDLHRLHKGKVGGTFWSVFADCPENGYNAEYYAEALATTEAAIDVIHRIHDRYPDSFGRPNNSTDALAIFQTGRIISPLGLEGLHLLGDSFTTLRNYHARGVRYATLTHNCNNAYADAAAGVDSSGRYGPMKPKWGGVSKAGRAMVQELNRLGIIVDLSHTSADTMRDVLGGRAKGTNHNWQGSLAPPIFSHSSAFALCPHPRNVPDDVLELVKLRQGIVMVTFSPGFVSCHWPDGIHIEGQLPQTYGPNLTVPQVVRHIRYIGDLVGYDYVGIGSDFDGVPSTLEGLGDVSNFPDLIAEMLKQGITDEDAEKITGKNLLRVWKAVDSVAESMQANGALPAEDDLPSLQDPWTLFS